MGVSHCSSVYSWSIERFCATALLVSFLMPAEGEVGLDVEDLSSGGIVEACDGLVWFSKRPGSVFDDVSAIFVSSFIFGLDVKFQEE